ncbi:MAG: hypothetical protein PUC34_02690 [Paludibacteraceae bacterium]|nr:hypothetical protein [Paludibacteraceae bacterium]
MNSSRTKREIKGRKKEREQDERTRAGRKREREQEERKERTRAGRNMPRDVFRMQASKAISVHKIIE